MNALVRPDIEIIPPGAGEVTLVLALHPLKLSAQRIKAPCGLTVAELVGIARGLSTTRIRSRLNVYLEGQLIPEAAWPRVRPKPGVSIVIRAVAEGGDVNNLLRSVLGIAVVGAAIFLAPVLAPILLPGVAGAAGLIGAAITVGGQLLINALFPIAPPQLGNDSRSQSQTYSIAGGQNTADPWGVVPVVLGKNRVYPKLGARSYTEFIGSDQYLRMLFVWGYGPLDISDIKIGETSIDDFSDVEIETRNGYVDDDPLTLFPNEVFQTDLSVDLTHSAGWQTRTTEADIDEISVDFVAPSGLVHYDSNGDSQNYTVSLRVEYSPTGAGTWSLLGTLNLTSKSTDPIRQALRLAVTNGQYDVRVEKTSSDYSGDDQVVEKVVWTALRGFRNSPPIAFPQPLALTALRIRATSQLNGIIDQLNGICESKVAHWDGSEWVDDTKSRNPGDLLRHVLQGPANAKPQADSRLDLGSIEAFANHCAANGYNFDMVRDFAASVADTATAVAAAGRGAMVFRDGTWSVTWESDDDPIVQHFTPRNSWGFSGQRAYVQTPHAFRVRFINSANGYQQDERIVYDDGYNADGSDGNTAATLFEEIEFPGVTDPDNIYVFGRYHIAQARLRPELYSLNVDIEHLVATRGDRVRVTHDVPMWGLASGRVISVDDPTVVLDEPLTMVSGHDYSIRFRLADGSSLVKTIQTVTGAQTSVTMTGGDLGIPAAGDLFLAGETGSESVVLRVRSITPGDDVSAKLSLVDDAPGILDAAGGTIPAFTSQISVPPALFAEAPTNLAVKEGFQGTGDNVVTGVFFSWETTEGQSPASFEAQFADDDGDGIYKPAGTAVAPQKYVFVTDYHGGNWSFRVRSIFADGTASAWAALTGQPLGGGTIIPKQVAPSAVNLEGLANEVHQALEYMGAVLRDVLADIEDQKAGVAAQDFNNYTDHQELLTKLVSQTTYLGQALTAAYENAILVATGPGSALVEDITAIYVALGGDSSGVNVRFSSSYAASAGWDAAFGLEAYSSIGDVFEAAGLRAEVKNGDARLFLIGSQVVIADSSGTVAALFNADGATINNARIANLDASNITAGSIDSTLLAADAVTAGKIDAGAIDASNLFVDGVVITEVIADNAITLADTVTSAGPTTNTSSTVSVTLQTATLTPNDGTVLIRASCIASVGSGTLSQTGHFNILKNGTVVASTPSVFFLATSSGHATSGIVLDWVDSSPGTSSVTYTFEVICETPSGVSIACWNNTISWVNAKK